MNSRNKFEWDEDNEDKLATKHGVDRYEAEEAAEDPDVVIRRVGKDRYGNPRYTYIGKTRDGRILFMVVDRKSRRTFRIGSARDADFGQKRFYRRKSRKQ